MSSMSYFFNTRFCLVVIEAPPMCTFFFGRNRHRLKCVVTRLCGVPNVKAEGCTRIPLQNYSANNLAMTWQFCEFTWTFLGIGWVNENMTSFKGWPFDLCETVNLVTKTDLQPFLGITRSGRESRITRESCFEFSWAERTPLRSLPASKNCGKKHTNLWEGSFWQTTFPFLSFFFFLTFDFSSDFFF